MNMSHVHGRYGDCESKIEFVLKNGVIEKIELKSVPGKKPLPVTQAKKFKQLASLLGDEIVQSWINYFVYNKKSERSVLLNRECIIMCFLAVVFFTFFLIKFEISSTITAKQ